MNVLEKILEEIEEKRESLVDMSDDEMELCDVEDWYDEGVKAGRMKAYLDVAETIRSHMDDVPNCGKCSRREWYQKGFEDGKKDNDWIPYTRQNTPKKKGIYLVTCDDEEYPVKRMRFKKEDEYGLWYDDYGIYDGVILAWQPLPEPYKKHRQQPVQNKNKGAS